MTVDDGVFDLLESHLRTQGIANLPPGGRAVVLVE